MLTIIIGTALGVIFALVAVENSQDVALNLFGNLVILPFYLILVITFLIGTFIASVFSLFDWTFAAFDLKKKENNFNNAIRANDALRNEIQKLENENIRLKEEVNSLKAEHNERRVQERKEKVKNFFHRITHPDIFTPSRI